MLSVNKINSHYCQRRFKPFFLIFSTRVCFTLSTLLGHFLVKKRTYTVTVKETSEFNHKSKVQIFQRTLSILHNLCLIQISRFYKFYQIIQSDQALLTRTTLTLRQKTSLSTNSLIDFLTLNDIDAAAKAFSNCLT